MSQVTAPGQPNPKDALFFLIILSNMKNKPDVDWAVVAEKAGLKNANTAATRFGQIKKKIGFTNGSSSATPSPSKSTPKKSKAGNGPLTTPSKVTKSRGGGRGKKATPVEEEPKYEPEEVNYEDGLLSHEPEEEHHI